MRGLVEHPAGLLYHPELLSVGEEQGLLGAVQGYDFEEVVMHGQAAKRTVRHFGFRHQFDPPRVVPGEPVPPELGSACTMRFQRRTGDQRRVFELALEPRSGYLLGGAARSAWQHGIPPVPALRYSVTFRSLRR